MEGDSVAEDQGTEVPSGLVNLTKNRRPALEWESKVLQKAEKPQPGMDRVTRNQIYNIPQTSTKQEVYGEDGSRYTIETISGEDYWDNSEHSGSLHEGEDGQSQTTEYIITTVKSGSLERRSLKNYRALSATPGRVSGSYSPVDDVYRAELWVPPPERDSKLEVVRQGELYDLRAYKEEKKPTKLYTEIDEEAPYRTLPVEITPERLRQLEYERKRLIEAQTMRIRPVNTWRSSEDLYSEDGSAPASLQMIPDASVTELSLSYDTPKSFDRSFSQENIDTEQINFLAARQQFLMLEKNKPDLLQGLKPQSRPPKQSESNKYYYEREWQEENLGPFVVTVNSQHKFDPDDSRQRENDYNAASVPSLSEKNVRQVTSRIATEDQDGRRQRGALRDQVPITSSSEDWYAEHSDADDGYGGGYGSDGNKSREVHAHWQHQELGTEPTYEHETPIEREIRLAMEREEELRRERGIQGCTNTREMVAILKTPVLYRSPPSSPGRKRKDNRHSSYYMKRDIEKETKREDDLKSEGKLVGCYDKGPLDELEERKKRFEQQDLVPVLPIQPTYYKSSDFETLQRKASFIPVSPPSSPGRKRKDNRHSSYYMKRDIEKETKREDDLKSEGNLVGCYNKGPLEELEERKKRFEQQDLGPVLPIQPTYYKSPDLETLQQKASFIPVEIEDQDRPYDGIAEVTRRTHDQVNRIPFDAYKPYLESTSDGTRTQKVPTSFKNLSRNSWHPSSDFGLQSPRISSEDYMSKTVMQDPRVSPKNTFVLQKEFFNWKPWTPELSPIVVSQVPTEKPLPRPKLIEHALYLENSFTPNPLRTQPSSLIEKEIQEVLQREEELQEQRRLLSLQSGKFDPTSPDCDDPQTRDQKTWHQASGTPDRPVVSLISNQFRPVVIKTIRDESSNTFLQEEQTFPSHSTEQKGPASPPPEWEQRTPGKLKDYQLEEFERRQTGTPDRHMVSLFSTQFRPVVIKTVRDESPNTFMQDEQTFPAYSTEQIDHASPPPEWESRTPGKLKDYQLEEFEQRQTGTPDRHVVSLVSTPFKPVVIKTIRADSPNTFLQQEQTFPVYSTEQKGPASPPPEWELRTPGKLKDYQLEEFEQQQTGTRDRHMVSFGPTQFRPLVLKTITDDSPNAFLQEEGIYPAYSTEQKGPASPPPEWEPKTPGKLKDYQLEEFERRQTDTPDRHVVSLVSTPFRPLILKTIKDETPNTFLQEDQNCVAYSTKHKGQPSPPPEWEQRTPRKLKDYQLEEFECRRSNKQDQNDEPRRYGSAGADRCHWDLPEQHSVSLFATPFRPLVFRTAHVESFESAPMKEPASLTYRVAGQHMSPPSEWELRTPGRLRDSQLEEFEGRRNRQRDDYGYAGIDPSDDVNNEIVESTRVSRRKSAMALRWEAGQYLNTQDE